MSTVKIELVKDLARHLREGHPWVYRRGIEKPPAQLAAGTIIEVTERGRFVARGYYDPVSPIAVRVLTRDPAEAVTPLFFRKRIARAVALRRAFVPFGDPGATDCVRLVHGEGDGLPGIVVDLYGAFAVLKLYSAGLAPHRGALLEALRGEVPLQGIYGRDEDRPATDDFAALPDDGGEEGTAPAPRGRVLYGAEPPDPLTVREDGVLFAVDVRAGQKTGFFLDQRENRRALRRYAKGRRVLNCFSYSGGFSVQAMLGGAREVTSVDRDGAALRLARRNFELNGIDPSGHRFVSEDVLRFLGEAKAAGDRYELIVLDPPAYAKTQKAVPAALDGYASLHRAALAVLARDGILATASCSARVSSEEFTQAVKEGAAKVGARLQLLEERRQPPDHPALLAFPEGRYLKFLVFKRLEE